MGWEAWFAVTVVLLVISLLMLTRVAPDIVMVSGVALLLLAGILTPEEAFMGMANEGMITVGIMYVIVAGLRETGGGRLDRTKPLRASQGGRYRTAAADAADSGPQHLFEQHAAGRHDGSGGQRLGETAEVSGLQIYVAALVQRYHGRDNFTYRHEYQPGRQRASGFTNRHAVRLFRDRLVGDSLCGRRHHLYRVDEPLAAARPPSGAERAGRPARVHHRDDLGARWPTDRQIYRRGGAQKPAQFVFSGDRTSGPGALGGVARRGVARGRSARVRRHRRFGSRVAAYPRAVARDQSGL